MPSSSSHALFGGLVGSSITYAGLSSINTYRLYHKIIPLFTSSILGFIIAFLVMILLSRLPNTTNKYFRRIQILSSAFVAYSHVLTKGSDIPLWVILMFALVMCIGTMFGAGRIMETLGKNISHLTTKSGIIMQISSWFGCGIYTTHIIGSSIVGVGIATNEGIVNNGLILYRIITIPVCMFISLCVFILITE